MRAVEITSYGLPDVLRLGERPVPVPGAGELLIRVAASGINRPDVLQRTGHYPVPPGASDIPGLEVAGVVEGGDAAAMKQAGIKVGDRVCALVAGGGYAELCVAPVVQCLPVPHGLSDAEAASLPETFFTVWSNVFDRGRLQKGETLLVHGGTSGIGVTAIQLGKAMGATVIVTAGSDEKCAACLAEDGRLVIIAVQGGVKSEINAGQVLRRRLTVTGSTLRPRPVAFKAAIAQSLLQRVWPLLEKGTVKPVIHSSFPAADAAAAHTLMEAGRHVGKIVLTW